MSTKQCADIFQFDHSITTELVDSRLVKQKSLVEIRKAILIDQSEQSDIFPCEESDCISVCKGEHQSRETVSKQSQVIIGLQKKRLVLDNDVLEMRISNKSRTFKKYAYKRIKLLIDLSSKLIRNDKISLETINRLANFCLETIQLIESGKIVMPTAFEFSLIIKWYLNRQVIHTKEPAVILTTVCPDYPFEKVNNEAVYTGGILGDNIGLIGESILNSAPHFLNVLSKTLEIPILWIVGYAGFEAKNENLKVMNMSFEEFITKLKKSARKLQERINVPVGILPELVGLTFEQFDKIRDSFCYNDFKIQRAGMEALSQAIDARDWACIYSIANNMNAIILDGASVFMGRKAYKKAGAVLDMNNHTPMFFCVSCYKGFK